jgi:hypothetical protein
MAMTPEEIRRAGLEALRKRLGRTGTIRFLQQFHGGQGDYATERHEWVNRTTLKDLRDTARRKRTKK